MNDSMHSFRATDNGGVRSASLVIGLDFGLCAPGEKFFYASVYLDCGDRLRHALDAFVYSRDELLVSEEEVRRADGL